MRFGALSGSLTRLTGGTSYLIAGSNITITSESNGAVTIAATNGAPNDASYVVLSSNATLTSNRVLTAGSGISITDGGPGGNVTITATGGGGGGTSYFDSTTVGSIFTANSAAFVGTEPFIDSPRDKGTDVFFYVSGSATVDNSSTNKALFGGDVRVSGSLTIGSGSITLTSNDIQFGSSTNRLELSGSNIKIYDSRNTSGMTLTDLGGFVLVESKYLTSPTQTITFSNLNGNSHRIYKIVLRRGNIASTTSYEIRPNGSTSGLSAYQHIYFTSHSVTSYASTWGLGSGFATNSQVGGIYTILAATGSYRWLDYQQVYDSVGTLVGSHGAGRWTDTTTNITSIDLYSSTASGWPSGTEAHLYRMRVG